MLDLVSPRFDERAAVRVERILRDHFPMRVLGYVWLSRIRIVPLSSGVAYGDASPYLAEQAPCLDKQAGVFVLNERTAYLRSHSPIAVAHEFGHALDCALGAGGRYRSVEDVAIRNAFRTARAFVTAYAATAVEEFFAESVRAFVGGNERRPTADMVSRALLRECSPEMDGIIEALFAEMAREPEQIALPT